MEASLPFSTLEGQEDFSATVQIAIPLRILGILEMRPHIIVNLSEPLEALLVSCELICLDEADCRLQMYPPKLLIPLQLLHITAGRLDEAQVILDGVPLNERDAEWYFLNGSVLYKRGWFNDAYSSFATAVRMEPGNMEYRQALNNMQRRGGFNSPYRTGGNMGGSGNTCDCCTSLICADCCCECMGGDLISCC